MSTRTRSLQPERLLAGLRGLPLSLLEASYGGELVVGFGETRPARPPLSGLDADWMLYTELSGWAIEGPEGVVSTSRQRDYAKAVDRARPVVLDRLLEAIDVRNGALGLTLRLSEGASILVLPDHADGHRDAHEAVWDLFGPADLLLKAIPAEGLVVAQPNAPA